MNTATAPRPPSKDERRAAFRRASWPERVAMHQAIAAAKAEAMEARRELGRRYLQRHAGALEVPFERAVAVANLAAETAAARAEGVALAKDRAAELNNGALEFPALAHDFAADSATIALAASPLIMAPVTRYCGMLPVLFNLFVTRAHTTELITTSAHLFHLDPEDVISFKVFIHLTEVDDDCGPFHALPADRSAEVIDKVGYVGIERITDEEMDRLVGWAAVVKVTGPPGTVAFADTTRCLHFGGRPRAPGKPVRDMIVFQYLLPTSLLFPVDGDAKHPRFLPHLEPTGDPEWDALIGARWT